MVQDMRIQFLQRRARRQFTGEYFSSWRCSYIDDIDRYSFSSDLTPLSIASLVTPAEDLKDFDPSDFKVVPGATPGTTRTFYFSLAGTVELLASRLLKEHSIKLPYFNTYVKPVYCGPDCDILVAFALYDNWHPKPGSKPRPSVVEKVGRMFHFEGPPMWYPDAGHFEWTDRRMVF